jgi:hypothetical protein
MPIRVNAWLFASLVGASFATGCEEPASDGTTDWEANTSTQMDTGADVDSEVSPQYVQVSTGATHTCSITVHGEVV